MYLKDLRAILNECSQAELKQIIVELYKSVPKAIIEERELDDFICATNKPSPHKNIQRQSNKFRSDIKKLMKQIDYFSPLRDQTSAFINNAKGGLYLEPNDKLPEAARLNWPKTVKSYINELINYPADSPQADTVTDLLGHLFILLNESYYFMMFEQEDCYAEVGQDPLGFYQIIVKRVVHKGVTAEGLIYLLKLVSENFMPPGIGVHAYFSVIHAELSTIANRKLALETAESLVPTYLKMRAEKNPPGTFLASPEGVYAAYNVIIMFIGEVQFASGTYDKGIKTFFGRLQNMPRADIYSQILVRLFMHQQDQLFKEFYQEARAKDHTLLPLVEDMYQRISQ